MHDHIEPPAILTILSSRLGLGQYIPSLLLKRRFDKAGIPAVLLFVEDYFTPEKKETFDKTKRAFNGNPHLARVASKLEYNRDTLFCQEEKADLISEWQQREQTHFICFSGYWSEILHAYADTCVITVDAIVIDARASAVWQPVLESNAFPVTVYQLFDVAAQRVNYIIPVVPGTPARPFHQRSQQVVAHGGGWSVFHAALITDIHDRYHKICLVNTTAAIADDNVSYYLNVMPEGKEAFPCLQSTDTGELLWHKDHHVSLDFIADARAIISKPGGMTLADALVTATPVIFLEGIGPHETANMSLWTTLGLGMEWAQWKALGFSGQPLMAMHNRLLEMQQGKTDLAQLLIEQYYKDNFIDHLNSYHYATQNNA